jgi:nucleoside diphosphate kinase
MTSGPVMVLKINSMEDTLIQDVRHIIEKLIRPKYAIDATANAIHASDSIEAAEYECQLPTAESVGLWENH